MRRQLPDLREWHPVFAWLPVTTQDGQRVWLERVERQYWGSSWFDDYFHYRLPASVTGTGTAKTAQPVEGRSPARTARRATPKTPHSHAEAKQPALSTGPAGAE